jgi:hypothetical protein
LAQTNPRASRAPQEKPSGWRIFRLGEATRRDAGIPVIGRRSCSQDEASIITARAVKKIRRWCGLSLDRGAVVLKRSERHCPGKTFFNQTV